MGTGMGGEGKSGRSKKAAGKKSQKSRSSAGESPAAARGRTKQAQLNAAAEAMKAGAAAAEAAAAKAPGASEMTDKLGAFGEAVWLMSQMPSHKHMFLSDLEWLIQPPISHQQIRLFREKGLPVAFVTWALLDEEVEQRVIGGNIRLKPGDWKSGDRPWIMDIVCPFGGVQKVLDEVKKTVFPNRTVKTVAPSPDGKGTRVVEM